MKTDRLAAAMRLAVCVALVALAALFSLPASAQNTDTYFYTPNGGGVNGAVGMCLNTSNKAVPCSAANVAPSPITILDGTATVGTSHPLPITGSFSATISGFTPGLTFATLTATASSASVALPAGAVVAFQNTGSATVSCTLGVGSATALANEIQIAPSSTVFVTVGSNTFGACIDQTGSASNLVVLAGGSGLGTGFGGGGGGGSGGTVNQGTGGASPWLFNMGSMGGTAITSGCVAALNSFPTAIPATVCGIWGAYVINTLPPGRAASTSSSPVVQPSAPSTWHLVALASTNATSVKASAATLFSCQLSGIGSTPAYLKIYNKASAPTVGTDTPVKTLIIPAAATAANGAGSNIQFGPGGMALGTGFAAAVTGGITDADTTAVAAATFAINCDYE